MPAKQILFYATAQDTCSGLARFEDSCSVQYVRTGLFDSPEPTVYETYKEIENIGYSLDGRIESLPAFLVVERCDEVVVREVPQKNGGVKYAVNARTTPSSITFTPSGEYKQECIIYGTVTGVDVTNQKSKNLFKLFGRHVLKSYEKIGSFKVSPGAVQKLDAGFRLTPNLKADQSMDLCR